MFKGQVYTLECDFYGFPFPEIKWTKDGKPLNSESYEFLEANRKLRINDLDPEKHNGAYQCEASNSRGTGKSRKFEIKVICK